MIKILINKGLVLRSAISVFIFCLLMSVHAENNVAISQISLEVADEFSLPFSDKIEIEVWSSDANKIMNTFTQWQDIQVSKVASDRLLVTLVQRPRYTGPVLPAYSKASFVIDYNEASSRQFVTEFDEQFRDSWELTDITSFVSHYITDTTYIHGFNFTSVVASQKSGDCTEYAALTTALSRAKGKPARLIIGTVILSEEGDVYAFGHAWTEVWHDGMWHIIDAALYEAAEGKRFYLPASAFKNEGTGYAFSLMESVTRMPLKITQLKHAL